MAVALGVRGGGCGEAHPAAWRTPGTRHQANVPELTARQGKKQHMQLRMKGLSLIHI